ncbi:MAG: hypothetical protein IKW97_00125 [Muribaculaceae bacterium]|nr:hypothetical protein [Muribaculaceae bacterium]
MKASRSGRWHDVAYWGLLVVAFAVMLVMNALTTFKEDDLAFTLIEGVWTPVRSFADLLQSHLTHYTGTNGRLAELVPELFAGLLGKTAFNVCNALVFVLLAHLVSLLATGRRSLLALSAFLAIVGTCYPVPGETMLWMAGSANYMWAITLSLALVYALKRAQGKPLGWGKALLWLLFGFVAGGFNEATSLGFLGGLMLFYAFNHRLFDRRTVVTMMGYALGIMLIVLSPGAWNRATTDIALNLSPDDLLSSRWYIFMEKMWRFYLPVLALIVGICLLVMRRGRIVMRSLWTYVLLCLAAVMFALGLNHERAYAPLVTVAAIIVIMAADALLSGRWRQLRLAAVLIALGLSVFTYARGIRVLSQYKAYNEQVEREISESPGQAILRECQFDGYSRFIKLMNYTSTNYFAHEVIYRAYYGKDNVQFVSDSVYVRFHEGRLLDGAQELSVKFDKPDVAAAVYTFADQDYIAVLLKGKSLPCTFQTARYYAHSDDTLDPEEAQRRKDYGINIDYEPRGFYPIEYQGKCYLISASLGADDHKVVFPMNLPPDPKEFSFEIQ